MDSSKRLLLALALSFVVTALFMWLTPSAPPPEPPPPDRGRREGPAAQPQPEPSEAPPLHYELAEPDGQDAELREVPQRMREVHYLVSTRGAGLVGAELQGAKMREQRKLNLAQGYTLLAGGEVPDAPQMDMARAVPGLPASLAVGVTGSSPLDPNAVWHLEEEGDGRYVFALQQGAWRAVKVLQWTRSNDPASPAAAGFEMALQVTLTNVSAQPVEGELGIHFNRAVEPGTEEKASFFGGVGNESKASCYVKDKLRHFVTEQDPYKPEDVTGPLRFFGVDQQYFLGVVFMPQEARLGRCELLATPAARGAIGYFPLSVAPGQSITEQFGVYVGPKDMDLLNQQPTAALGAVLGMPTAPPGTAHLGQTVDFGIWEVICVVLLAILKFFHGVFGNWGLAIIFLTVVVKLALLPLTIKSMMAAENMKKLQPKVEEIRKKFKEDPTKMNQEMMKLYQEAKVNPLGGCFPLLLQMPVWIALFTTLRASYEIYREPFISPVWADLTYKDPTYILPVLLGVSMILTQRLQPAMMDKAQQRLMMWFMPIFFTLLMLAYPAGLTLYIFTNNALSIGQQYGLRRWMARKGAASAPAK
jgi:YidC/Oxa1 family membrane protein insertase